MTTSSPYLSLANQYAAQYGIPPQIFDAQIQAESGWNQGTVSNTGAVGLGQLEPSTAQALGVNPYSAASNLQGSAAYDAQMYKDTGSYNGMLQAYNGGLSTFQSGGNSATKSYAAGILNSAGYGNTSNGSAENTGTLTSANQFNTVPNQGSNANSSQTPGTISGPYGTFGTPATVNTTTGAVTPLGTKPDVFAQIATFFSDLMKSSTWFDIGFVIIGGILLFGAFMHETGGKMPIIPVE